jgi:hypothetical protein
MSTPEATQHHLADPWEFVGETTSEKSGVPNGK